MQEKKVKEIMIPLSDYAIVSEEDNLCKAIKELRKARDNTKYKYKHRAVLVCDKTYHITGKLSIRCILKALEPKYRQFEHADHHTSLGLSRFGFNDDFLNSLLENLSLWDESLEELVVKASKKKVKDLMYIPSKGEYVDEDAFIGEAIHQFILGCHQSILVMKKDKVVGIIRLGDIFALVCKVLE
jgi:CBS domain containing-hemolysin-like protein